MNVLVTLNPGLGAGLGPNFLVYSDVGTFIYNATLTELLNGIELTFEDTASIVIIESLGICINILPLPIEPTTTTTTTLPCNVQYTIDDLSAVTTTTTTTIGVCIEINYSIDAVESATTTTTTTLPPSTTTTTTVI